MMIGLEVINILYIYIHGLEDSKYGFPHFCEQEDPKFGLPHFYGKKDSKYDL